MTLYKAYLTDSEKVAACSYALGKLTMRLMDIISESKSAVDASTDRDTECFDAMYSVQNTAEHCIKEIAEIMNAIGSP